ncbi:MAG: hypothetical protein WC890_00265 [Candidatus Margulisiibacteriota bacterium]
MNSLFIHRIAFAFPLAAQGIDYFSLRMKPESNVRKQILKENGLDHFTCFAAASAWANGYHEKSLEMEITARKDAGQYLEDIADFLCSETLRDSSHLQENKYWEMICRVLNFQVDPYASTEKQRELFTTSQLIFITEKIPTAALPYVLWYVHPRCAINRVFQCASEDKILASAVNIQATQMLDVLAVSLKDVNIDLAKLLLSIKNHDAVVQAILGDYNGMAFYNRFEFNPMLYSATTFQIGSVTMRKKAAIALASISPQKSAEILNMAYTSTGEDKVSDFYFIWGGYLKFAQQKYQVDLNAIFCFTPTKTRDGLLSQMRTN